MQLNSSLQSSVLIAKCKTGLIPNCTASNSNTPRLQSSSSCKGSPAKFVTFESYNFSNFWSHSFSVRRNQKTPPQAANKGQQSVETPWGLFSTSQAQECLDTNFSKYNKKRKGKV